MNSDQFERWLKKKHNIRVFPQSRSGHVELENPANGRISILPRHGGRKQLHKGLMEQIKKDLGIK